MLLFLCSCKKGFLDVVPDNVATLDNAFASKAMAITYLSTCYNGLPNDANLESNPGILAGDEIWTDDLGGNGAFATEMWQIAKGYQNITSPLANTWDGGTFKSIRNCNIFLENVTDLSKVPDLDLETRVRWIAEARFLKAYYHFLLLRAYGPIPIIDQNQPINAPVPELRVKRQPVDSAVNYIAGLLDSAAAHLPLTITSQITELGRVTQPIALSIKAKLLTMAASPLFNGNPDYTGFANKDGQALFNTTYSAAKWQRAADACKAAIGVCEAAGISLYQFPGTRYPLTDTTMTQMSIRNAVCEKWNSEIIWGRPGGVQRLQSLIPAKFDPAAGSNAGAGGRIGATLKIAQQFYTRNGVPIDEDRTLDFSSYSALRVATHDERYNLIEGYTTARLNFDREPRFYADLGFDGCVWYMQNSPSNSDNGTWTLPMRSGTRGATISQPITCYFLKKLLNWEWVWQSGNSYFSRDYSWPIIRLADLYLLYAEALNEAQGPVADVLVYMNKVRKRAGLGTVQDSWTNYSTRPSKYTTKEGMRDIVRRERLIELCFEGHRFWDLKRWKLSAQELNKPVMGWDRTQTDAAQYYRPQTLFFQQFIAPRDYFFPIKDNNLLVNDNLVQNPGW